MSRDIYSIYLKNIDSKNDTENVENSKKASIKSQQQGIFDSSEAVEILREISNKLDAFNERNSKNITNSVNFINRVNNEIDIAILNGKVVIPDVGVVETDVYIDNGKIYSIGKNDYIKAKEIIDASGKFVIPGIIDPHVHLGIFAPFKTELITETKAALLGGITTIGCFINTEDSHFKKFPYIKEDIDKFSYVDIIPHLVISTQVQRKEILDYINYLDVTSFKVYMNGIPGLIPDVDDGFILDVFEEIKKSNKKCIVCSHCENRYLVRRAYDSIKQQKGNKANIVDWSDTHPDMAEEEAVMRLSYFAEKTGVETYFVHISTAAAINRLRKIKPFNKYIHIETTSPYLSLTKYSLKNNAIKMEPPFRDYEDLEELWKAVENDIVDTIGTDNVTMTKSEKKVNESIWETMPGYSVLETHLPILLHEGVIKREIPIEKIITKITKKPAEIFNVYPQKGTILPGSDADVVIVDLNKIKEVKSLELLTRSDFSIYEDRKIQGWPITTIKSGEIVVEDGKYLNKKARGICISR